MLIFLSLTYITVTMVEDSTFTISLSSVKVSFPHVECGSDFSTWLCQLRSAQLFILKQEIGIPPCCDAVPCLP